MHLYQTVVVIFAVGKQIPAGGRHCLTDDDGAAPAYIRAELKRTGLLHKTVLLSVDSRVFDDQFEILKT